MIPKNIKWVDITDKYTKFSKHGAEIRDEQIEGVCDWGSGCNNEAKFRVTLKDGFQRYLCGTHLLERLESCDYTHKKVEKLEESE